MKNVFLFGASFVHGVGGPQGGWADKIKLTLHRELYGEDASGESCQIYELGVPGTTISDLLARFEPELNARVLGCSPKDTIIVLQNGANDAKAINSPEAYVTAPADFDKRVRQLLEVAKQYAAHVIVLGLPPADERKVRPKHNPITGTKSYFSNTRLKQFEDIWLHACTAAEVTFIPLHDEVPDVWIDRYLFTDGMHPNDQGYQWIASRVEPVVRKLLGDRDD